MAVGESKNLQARLRPDTADALDRLARRLNGASLNEALNVAVQATEHPCEVWAQRVLLLSDPQAVEEVLEAAAREIQVATDVNAGAFTSTDWEVLAQALRGVLWSGKERRIGHRIAGLVRDAQDVHGSAERIYSPDGKTAGWQRRYGALLRSLECLSDVRGWALIYAVRWYWQDTHSAQTKNWGALPWWTLAARTVHDG